MKNENPLTLAAAVVSAAFLLSPAHSQTRPHFDLSFEGGVDRCADLKVRSSNGEVARADETFSLTKAAAPTLEISALQHGIIRVRGWDRADYSVETCKIAVAADRARADQALKGIAVGRSAGRFSASGPTGDDVEWQVYFIVHAPKDASLDLETRNGPIDVGGVSGTIKARATNGPLAIRDSSGAIQGHTVNGPISFSGGAGDVDLKAQNGPISLKLAGETWEGAHLSAATVNGPVHLALPERFRSGVRLETSPHGLISCRAGICGSASATSGTNQRAMQLNGSNDTVRVTTEHGPVSVTGAGKMPRTI